MIGGDAIQVFCRIRPDVTVQDNTEAHEQKVRFTTITILHVSVRVSTIKVESYVNYKGKFFTAILLGSFVLTTPVKIHCATKQNSTSGYISSTLYPARKTDPARAV